MQKLFLFAFIALVTAASSGCQSCASCWQTIVECERRKNQCLLGLFTCKSCDPAAAAPVACAPVYAPAAVYAPAPVAAQPCQPVVAAPVAVNCPPQQCQPQCQPVCQPICVPQCPQECEPQCPPVAGY